MPGRRGRRGARGPRAVRRLWRTGCAGVALAGRVGGPYRLPWRRQVRWAGRTTGGGPVTGGCGRRGQSPGAGGTAAVRGCRRHDGTRGAGRYVGQARVPAAVGAAAPRRVAAGARQDTSRSRNVGRSRRRAGRRPRRRCRPRGGARTRRRNGGGTGPAGGRLLAGDLDRGRLVVGVARVGRQRRRDLAPGSFGSSRIAWHPALTGLSRVRRPAPPRAKITQSAVGRRATGATWHVVNVCERLPQLNAAAAGEQADPVSSAANSVLSSSPGAKRACAGCSCTPTRTRSGCPTRACRSCTRCSTSGRRARRAHLRGLADSRKLMREHGVPQFTVDSHRPVARSTCSRLLRHRVGHTNLLTALDLPAPAGQQDRGATPGRRSRRARRVQPDRSPTSSTRRCSATVRRRSLEITGIVGTGSRRRPGGRDELLLRLARTEERVRPAFYDVDYLPDGDPRVVPKPCRRGRSGCTSAPR